LALQFGLDLFQRLPLLVRPFGVARANGFALADVAADLRVEGACLGLFFRAVTEALTVSQAVAGLTVLALAEALHAGVLAVERIALVLAVEFVAHLAELVHDL